MSQQIAKGTTYTTASPGNQVTAANLNNLADQATLTNGAVIDQANVSTRAGNIVPLAADMILLGDSTEADTAVPLMVPLSNLLLQSQRDGTQRWGGVAGGTANALTLATTPASAGAYVTGETVRFKTANAANTGAVTVNLDGRGVVNLYNFAVAALVAGDLPANATVEAIYDGTQFQVATCVLPAKSITSYMVNEKLRGTVQQFAVATGTNTIAMAPLDSSGAAAFTSLVTGMQLSFQAGGTNTGAATLAVNGLGAQTIKRIVAGAVADLAANDIQTGDVVTVRYNGTYFIMIGRARSWDFVDTAQALPGNGALLTRAHGLALQPTKVRVVLVCQTINLGYAVGMQVEIAGGGGTSTWQVYSDATNVYVAQTNTSTPSIIPAAGGAGSAITAADWKILIYASL